MLHFMCPNITTLCCTLIYCLKALQILATSKLKMLIYSIQLSELILVIKSVPIWFTHRA